jgi:transcription elongation factor Elf1
MERTLALLNLLERILGSGEKRNKGNYAFYCPNCKHHKRKLEVNVELGFWECWVCGKRDNFKGRKIIQLLKKLNTPQNLLDELYLIQPNERNANEVVVNDEKCHLPKGFTNLHNFIPGSRIEFIKIKQAIHFSTIQKYNKRRCYKISYWNLF